MTSNNSTLWPAATGGPVSGAVVQGSYHDPTRGVVVTVDEPADGFVVLRVTGDLDVVTAPEMGRRLRECTARSRTVLLDLRAVSFLGCAALAMIDAAGASLGSRDERLVVACSRAVRRSLQVSGVDRHVTVLSV